MKIKGSKEKQESFIWKNTKLLLKFILYGKIYYDSEYSEISQNCVKYDMDSVFPNKEIENKVIEYIRDEN